MNHSNPAQAFIEKKLAAFNLLWSEDDTPRLRTFAAAFLTTALQEALLAGIELAEGEVPEAKTEGDFQVFKNTSASRGYIAGQESFREKTLARLAALKESVGKTAT